MNYIILSKFFLIRIMSDKLVIIYYMYNINKFYKFENIIK